MSSTQTALYTLLALILLVLSWHYHKTRSRRRILNPPSPGSLPLVGNWFSLPPSKTQHAMYVKLGDQLESDIVYLQLFGLKVIFLNSSQAASDLLEKRSSIYSDRYCPLILGNKSPLNWSTNPLFLGCNDTWRHHRRMMNKWLNKRDVVQFYPMQEKQAQNLLRRLLNVSAEVSPFKSVKSELTFAMASSSFQAVYGYNIQGINDPVYQAADEADRNAEVAMRVPDFFFKLFFALNLVPEWFPGADWKRKLRKWGEQKNYALDVPYQSTRNQVKQGTYVPSIIGTLLQNNISLSVLSPEEMDDRLRQLGHVLYSGATGATSSVLLSFIAAMVLKPGVQAQAQQEIDSALGPGVLPTVADQERLPYVNRIILELLRWRPPTPTGIPHRCFEDDVYRGFNIRKGTLVVGNIWAMGRDKKVYKDPETFNPDRFLDPNVPPLPAFGWGRRICPGINFGQASLFVTIASLLSTFTFSRKKDSNGNYIDPVIQDAPDEFILGLEPFEFEFAPRSDMHRRVVQEVI